MINFLNFKRIQSVASSLTAPMWYAFLFGLQHMCDSLGNEKNRVTIINLSNLVHPWNLVMFENINKNEYFVEDFISFNLEINLILFLFVLW